MLLIIFCFLSIFSYGGPGYENTVRVVIRIKNREYISYVILSSEDERDSFFIIREEI